MYGTIYRRGLLCARCKEPKFNHYVWNRPQGIIWTCDRDGNKPAVFYEASGRELAEAQIRREKRMSRRGGR